ncbi:MAG: Mur ligase family protein [Treponema sp.]|nr:Mur ligase family protein [Treponema sp.]
MSISFTTSKEVFEWLSGFINLERGQKPKSFRLERMETLTELANHPERCAPSIHIAGSKGKGSVTSMLAAILTAAGYKTARYMSPHVIDIRERICLGDSYFDEDIYCTAGDELRHVAEELLPAAANPLFDTNTPDGCEPTFWELLTLLFFLCARRSKCDIMVVETGMGGRLDSTNVLIPLISVITLIELEHTSILGDTIPEIAGEKAGIIKPGIPVLIAKQTNEALEVFQKKSQEKNNPLYYLPEIANLSDINITPHGTKFNLSFSPSILHTSHSTLVTPHYTLTHPVPGKVQAENAALAITALKIAFNNQSASGADNNLANITDDAIFKGLTSLKIPARFENIHGKDMPPFIIDGAHTPESLALCIDTFCSLYGKGGILLFGCAADKDASAMAKIAHSHFSKIIITTPGTFKTSNPVHVYESFIEITGREKTELIKDTQEAVKRVIFYAKHNSWMKLQRDTEDKNGEKGVPILGTGSFYLVAEIRKYLLKK